MIEKTEARIELELSRPAPRLRTLQSLHKQLERLQVRLAAAQAAAQRTRR